MSKEKSYYENLDKRTKEYKDWKENYDKAPKGLGDVIEKVTEATGIKAITKKVFGEDCGCDERKNKANKLLRLKTINCFTEEEYNQWSDFRDRKEKNKVTVEHQTLIVTLLRSLFGIAVKPCQNCSGQVWLKYINRIDKFYESY